jgi:hypothetical protein
MEGARHIKPIFGLFVFVFFCSFFLVLPLKRITACFKQTNAELKVMYEMNKEGSGRNNQQIPSQSDESLTGSSRSSVNQNVGSSSSTSHYYAPVTSLENLRKRYGSRKSVFGDWTNQETRQFYKQQLPRSLQSEFYNDSNYFQF